MRSKNIRYTHLYSHKLIAKSFAECLHIKKSNRIECISIRNIDGTNDISINIEITLKKGDNTSLNKFDKIMNELNESDSVTFKTMKTVLLSHLAFDPYDLKLNIQQIAINSTTRKLSTHMIINSDSKLDQVSPDGSKAASTTTFIKNTNGTSLEMPIIPNHTTASTTTMETPQPTTPYATNCRLIDQAYPSLGMNDSQSLDFDAIE